MQVPVGKTTVFGGGVTLVAFALAIVAYLQGARDEATLGTLAVGLVGLIGTLGGRYGQAIAALFADRSSWGARRSQHVPTEAEIGGWTTTRPRPSVGMTNDPPEPLSEEPQYSDLARAIADAISDTLGKPVLAQPTDPTKPSP